MKTVTINRNNYGIRRDIINVKELYTDNVHLYIVIDGFYKVKPGDYIEFNRSVYAESEQDNVVIANVRKEVLNVEHKDNETIVTVNAEAKTALKITEIDEEDGYYVVWFNNTTNIFAQDIVFANNKRLTPTLQIFDTSVGRYKDIVSQIYFNEYNKITGKQNYKFIVSGCQSPSNFIYNAYTETDYNDCDKVSPVPEKMPMYYYLPFKTYRNVLSVKENISAYTGDIIYYKYNQFYCQEDSTTTFNGLTVYRCYLWEDVKGNDGKRDVLNEDNTQKYNSIVVSKIMDFWGVSVGLTANNDYEHLFQEENVTKLYTEKVKKKVIDENPVIDMEKIKFIPYCNNETITEIRYNLHFRQRDLENNWSYIEGEDACWNPELSEDSGLTPDNLNGSWSDMLYYLGFTDSDVQNQKQKIRKSFLRLSFYDNNDPMTQKLLYYSTIFMDSGEFLGKWIKAKNELLKNGENGDNVVLNSESSDKYRLDCSFIVKNEYCYTKSSDGFNIYYFPGDVSESEGKTIYMKVEFNHAGYGRTVPMIVWPEGASANGLTLEDIKNGAMYIPLTLKVLEGKKYVYEIETNKYIQNNQSVLTLNLFEPKLLD